MEAPIASASVLIVIFAVALVVFVKLLSLVPGSSALSPLVTLGLPLALGSWRRSGGEISCQVSNRLP